MDDIHYIEEGSTKYLYIGGVDPIEIRVPEYLKDKTRLLCRECATHYKLIHWKSPDVPSAFEECQRCMRGLFVASIQTYEDKRRPQKVDLGRKVK